MDTILSISVERCIELFRSIHGEKVLILDTRPFMSFNTCHIENSTNVHCPPILKRRSGGFVALENIVPCEKKRECLLRGDFTTVIAYDQNTTLLSDAAQDSSLYSVLKSLNQQVDVPNIYYLAGGFDAFQDVCPALCLNQSVTSGYFHNRIFQMTPRKTEPVEILPHLYLGNYQHACQGDLLKTLGITSLINVSTTCQNQFEADFRYMNIPVNDTSSAELLSWFSQANEFIDAVKLKEGKVLVHCQAGVSRSATICLAYLMSANRLSLDKAYEHVRARRDVIDPNLNFMQQLKNFEIQLTGSRNVKQSHLMQTPDETISDLTSNAFPSMTSTSEFTFSPQEFPSDASSCRPLSFSPQDFTLDAAASRFSFNVQEYTPFCTPLLSPS
ncbi:dual specificity protein phosphatase 1-like [Gigantopelta aegis]|uniref:dual specificity protein phosphatase 1-like n=1 Tax=Gigantopelta aegis TaxID=1735272 RepID=UPI001B887942|nr:dual specificity protein phosphatase 1-like [Gigantopelta aegis]